MAPLSSVGWLNESSIASIAAGTRRPSAASVGFLSNLLVLEKAVRLSGQDVLGGPAV